VSKRYVIYYRVSTKKQGRSGLGLEAQQVAVKALVGDGVVLGSYTEIETGKTADRPELQKAIAHARMAGAILIVAKLDRLARNVAFISALMASGLEFFCGDCDTANRVVVHIMAALAEHEAKLIAERTKAALAAAKARGTLLGSARPGHWDGRQRGHAKASARAAVVNREAWLKKRGALLPDIKERRAAGQTISQITDWLNSRGYLTLAGKPYTVATVWRIIERHFGREMARQQRNLPILQEKMTILAEKPAILAGVA
jgi:DNA invertase Pin-like site-specific DNA recombinase